MDACTNHELRELGLGSYGERVCIHRTVCLFSPEKIRLGDDVRIDCFSMLSAGEEEIHVGSNVHIGASVLIYGRGGAVRLGELSNVSPRATLFTYSEDFLEGRLINPTIPAKYRGGKRGAITLERLSAVGSGTVVMPGVTLGKGAVVGAMSFVRDDVPAFQVAAGIPARVIGRRNQELAERLEQVFHEEQATAAEFTSSPPRRCELVAYVLSWKRPGFLARTLDSLHRQLDGVEAFTTVLDNDCGDATRAVIEEHSWIGGVRPFPRNLGINGALEAAVPSSLEDRCRFVLVSADDMEYRAPLRLAIHLLKERPEIGAVSFQHSPEHLTVGEISHGGRSWPLKRSERGCALVMSAADFQAMRPFPVENLLDYDWWVMRDAPRSFQAQGRYVAVLTGGARHLGWRLGDSPWQPNVEIPEYDEYRG